MFEAKSVFPNELCRKYLLCLLSSDVWHSVVTVKT